MHRRRHKFIALNAGLALILALPALADLYTAQVAYEKKDYAAAFKEFRALAELGQPLAQYDLAVMYARGEGAEASNTYAYAWATLAAENGLEGGRKLADELRPMLTPGSIQLAQDIERQFNRDALDRRLMPRMMSDAGYTARIPCRKDKMYIPAYPADARDSGIQGQVFVEFTVMPDGRARLPRMIYSIPPKVFEKAARTGILRSKFVPATMDGKPVPCSAVFYYRFTTDDSASDYGELESYVRKTREKAMAGDARAQTLYAYLLAGLPQLKKSYSDALPWFLKAAQSGVPVAQYQVGYSLLIGRGCQCEENKGAEWLRKAAEADQPDAQVTLARYALRGTPDAAATNQAKIWLEHAVNHDSADGKLYLAALLAATPIDAVRDPKRALALMDGIFDDFDEDPTTFEIRAAARANLGDFKAAVKDQAKAVAIATRLEWDVTPQSARLTLYRARQSWRGDLLAF